MSGLMNTFLSFKDFVLWIIMTSKGASWDFFQSALCTTNCLQTASSHVKGVMCEPIPSTHWYGHVVWRHSSAVSFDRVKSHLFSFCLLNETMSWWRCGGNWSTRRKPWWWAPERSSTGRTQTDTSALVAGLESRVLTLLTPGITQTYSCFLFRKVITAMVLGCLTMPSFFSYSSRCELLDTLCWLVCQSVGKLGNAVFSFFLISSSSSSFTRTATLVALTNATVCRWSDKVHRVLPLLMCQQARSLLEVSGESNSSAAVALLSLEMCRRATLQNDQYGAWWTCDVWVCSGLSSISQWSLGLL